MRQALMERRAWNNFLTASLLKNSIAQEDNMVDWEQAWEVFAVGLSGVFLTLTVLLVGITLYSKIILAIKKMTDKKAEEVK